MKPNFHIQWHITEKCNLNCLHCYKEPFRRELAIDKLKLVADNIINFVKKKGFVLTLTVTGGEPFLKDEVYNLTKYLNCFSEIKEMNFISNGTVLPKENFVIMKKMNKYYVSLESWDKENNDIIRGKNVFEKVLNNINILKQKGYNIGIMLTLMNTNIKFLTSNFDKLYKMLEKYQIDEIIFERFVAVGNAKNKIYEVVENDNLLKFYSSLSEYFKLDYNEIKDYKALKITFLYKDGDIVDSSIYGAQCTSGKDGVAILCDGTVYPCRRLDIPLGNLLKDELENLVPCETIFKTIQNKDLFNCYAMTKSLNKN